MNINLLFIIKLLSEPCLTPPFLTANTQPTLFEWFITYLNGINHE